MHAPTRRVVYEGMKDSSTEHRNVPITSGNKGFKLFVLAANSTFTQPPITYLKLASLELLSKSRIKMRLCQNIKRYRMSRKRLSFEGSSAVSHFTSLVFTNIFNQNKILSLLDNEFNSRSKPNSSEQRN